MIRLEMKKCNMILTKKKKKYRHYCLDKHEYLTDEEILLPNQRQ